MKKIFTFLAFAMACGNAFGQQSIVASWGFDAVTTSNSGSTPVISAGSATADGGTNTAGSAFTGFHAGSATWSNTAGNGSVKSLSSNTWAVGDYYQFKASATGFSGISLTWDQIGSSTGPKDFKVQYSTNGTTYTDVPTTLTNATYALGTTTWSAGTATTASTRTVDLSTITTLDNAAFIYFRFTMADNVSIGNGTVASTGTGRIDNVTIKGTATATPLTLISFTAASNNTNVSLNWTTANEQQVKGFDVEKSNDGSNFNQISFVPAKNNIVAGKYSISDAQGNNTTYYRLKVIDKDGTISYSKVLTVLNNKETSRLAVYPNPVSGGVLTIVHTATTAATLQVADAKGAIVLKSSVANDELQTGINVSSLPNGNYFIIFQNGTTRQSVPFCKY